MYKSVNFIDVCTR